MLAKPLATRYQQSPKEMHCIAAQPRDLDERGVIALPPGRRILMLHAFVKKSAKTPARELKIARSRLKEIKENADT